VTNIVRNTTRVLRGLFAFRWLTIVFGVALLAVRWSVMAPPEPPGRHPPLAVSFLLPMLISTLYLFIPGLESRFKRFYLPIALALAVLDFSIQYGISYIRPGAQIAITLPSGQEISIFWASTEMILMTLVPCVLAGAAYGTRGGIMTATLATLFHLVTGIIIWLSGVPLRGFMILLPLRIAVLYVFPLITGYLADTWRQEHTAVLEGNRQLRGYAATVEHLATSRERVRLARAMHDTLAHTLSALVVQLEAVDALQETDPVAAASQLDKIRGHARVGLDEARKAIMDLRSSPVEELGLTDALEQLVKQFGRRNGIRTEWAVKGSSFPLLPVQANALYRIAEEALDNTARHAEAGQVTVQLNYDTGVTVRIQDDGQGFDPKAVDGDRYGLMGIHERAALVDGSVSVASTPNEGTTLTIQIAEPWKE
jgi:signal transduction histidine kinase